MGLHPKIILKSITVSKFGHSSKNKCSQAEYCRPRWEGCRFQARADRQHSKSQAWLSHKGRAGLKKWKRGRGHALHVAGFLTGTVGWGGVLC